MIWSDEAHFELFNRKNRTLVRRKMSERDRPFSFVPRMQNGGGSVSVWGCMTSSGLSNLVFYEGRVNGGTSSQMCPQISSVCRDNGQGYEYHNKFSVGQGFSKVKSCAKNQKLDFSMYFQGSAKSNSCTVPFA